ncbi:FAD-dependent oxidoreductase [Lachnoclostridium pacaense]|uniref:NAD(P)/FAD-dependent oxidoreductase n=1 Tax=Enterocloster hominis (ex Hitch et al. 2024) TaxID=1917870 RepID=UPI001D125886|nr:FAD-dependent oxidoreductase [Lachnoclostridium pacaense]MCC2820154.1 FAD-dependent oxidoreductase [Lachnoclostridium pacaense]
MRYVVLGASAAGVNGVRQLRKQCPEAEIILVSKDSTVYSRCILHHYLGNMRTKEELCFAEEDFEDRYKVDWRKGVSCTGLDDKEKKVILSDGTSISYDRLLIATGSHTLLPPVKGLQETEGVYGFHNLDEVESIKKRAGKAEHIVVMGGGLTGLDAAVGFLHLGKKADLVEMEGHLLAKQLDARSSKTYEEAMENEGIRLHLGVGIREVCSENGTITSLKLTDGSELACDMLVVTAGVRPNIDFLKGSGVECDQFGLVIDRYGQTSVPDIYGAGDVTGRSPIWPAAVKQGMVAAVNMAMDDAQEGRRATMEDFFASKSTMNFLDIPTMSLGIPERPDHSYEVVLEDRDGIYRKVIHKNGKIYGAILQGDLSYGGVLTQLIASKIDVSKVKKPLFEIDYSDFFHTKDNFEFYYEEA